MQNNLWYYCNFHWIFTLSIDTKLDNRNKQERRHIVYSVINKIAIEVRGMLVHRNSRTEKNNYGGYYKLPL